MSLNRYFAIYKPFGFLSQFSGEKQTLKELWDFPVDVYPVGRLDKDSEGLLLITNDKSLNHRLLNPIFAHKRTYFAQVEGIPLQEDIEKLKNGVEITIDRKLYRTQKANVKLMPSPPHIPDRIPAIRFRKKVLDSWLELTLIEGKNRQVRKMTAAAGFPTLRLVRFSIEKVNIEGFELGEVREFDREEFYHLLSLNPAKFSQNKMIKDGKSYSKTSSRKKKK